MKIMSHMCVLLLIIVIATFSACSTESDICDYGEEERVMDLLTKSLYGHGMLFRFRIIVDGEARIMSGSSARMRLNPRDEFHDPFYTDLIFVHNEAEANALDLPDNIIVAWPRDAEWTDRLIAGIHWAVNRTEDEIPRGWGQQLRPVVTLEEFGLFYPITIEDLVDNWEKVNALWTTFTDSERQSIHNAAPMGGSLVPDPEADAPPTGDDE